MVSNANVDCITGTNDTVIWHVIIIQVNNKISTVNEINEEKNLLGDAMRSCQDPLGSNQSTSAQVLIQRVDQSNLPTIFTR